MGQKLRILFILNISFNSIRITHRIERSCPVKKELSGGLTDGLSRDGGTPCYTQNKTARFSRFEDEQSSDA